MNNFLIRTFTGVVFALLVLGSIVISPWAFFVLMGIFSLIGLHEFYPIFTKGQKGTLLYYVLGALTYVVVAFSLVSYIDFSNVLLIVLGFFLVMAAELFRTGEHSWKRIGAVIVGIVYVSIPFGMMNSFFFLKSADIAIPWVLLALFILVWVNDVFAYLAGSTFGKHKLFEEISPKKTWEGTLSGIVFTLLFSWLFSMLSDNLNLLEWLGFGLIVSVTAIIGDLIESMLKRNASVKDSGTLLPGHGGVLDRFDAIIFATPFVFYYLFLL
ncbi:MAG: phosphatidate cytidylyltransferase [Bacteroidales bacterium]|nr:phosphatidate cytidylyltransferase [Bacteroidales bacterium]